MSVLHNLQTECSLKSQEGSVHLGTFAQRSQIIISLNSEAFIHKISLSNTFSISINYTYRPVLQQVVIKILVSNDIFIYFYIFL